MKKMYVMVSAALACPCRCHECPIGDGKYPMSSALLDPAKLCEMLGEIAVQVGIKRVFLYSHGEPALHPGLPDLVHTATQFAPVTVSTTGNICRCSLEDLSASGLDELLISFKGWSRETYRSNMPGGDLDYAVAFARCAARYPFKRVIILWHRYRNNLHEESAAREFAKELGVGFRADWAMRLAVDDVASDREFPNLVLTGQESRAILNRCRARPCGFGFNSVYLSHDGVLYLCGAASNPVAIGNVFSDRLEDLNRIRESSHECARCIESRSSRAVCETPMGIDWACVRKSPFQWRYYAELAQKFLYRLKEGRL